MAASFTPNLANYPKQYSFLSPSITYNSSRKALLISWPSSSWSFGASRCQKMYVPGFGEGSPEQRAANNLHDFFTYVAVKVVLAQLQSYNSEAHKELMEFLSRNSLNDGDKFLADLMRESSRHKSLALRILEVRSSYCKKDFEWDNLKRLAVKRVNASNTKLMRDYIQQTSNTK